MKKGKKKLPLLLASFLSFASIAPLSAIYLNDVEFKSSNKPTKEALLELQNFRYFELQDGDEGAEVLGRVGYHFKDKDEIIDFRVEKKDVNGSSKISSKKAIKNGDLISLVGDVRYYGSDGYRLFTDSSNYHQKKELLTIDGPFRVEGEKMEAYGASSSVDMRNKRVSIESVRAKLNF